MLKIAALDAANVAPKSKGKGQEVIRPAPAWEVPRVIAHRCGGALAPENTLAGCRSPRRARLSRGGVRRHALRRLDAVGDPR